MSRGVLWLLLTAIAAGAGSAGPSGAAPPSVRAPAAQPVDPMSLRLPDMNFRQARLADILDWIRDRSAAADPVGVGANLIFKDDGRLGGISLTIRLKQPTVGEALALLSSVAPLYIRRDPRAIVIERSASPVPAR